MPRRIAFTIPAERDLSHLSHENRERVRLALQRFVTEQVGDFKRLRGRDDEWRLRVGDLRVLCRPEGDHESGTLAVIRVLPRDRAYRE